MEQQKAAEILIGMLSKRRFGAEEKEAIVTALGVLAWTTLSKSRIKAIKAKRDRDSEWK